MKNSKLIVFLFLICLIIPNIAYSAEIKSDKSQNKKQELKAKITDKNEYINQDWWSRFNDPVLSGYINKSANSNYDLKIASLKVLETQALVRESLGKEFPLLNLGSDFSRKKTSNNTQWNSPTQNSYIFPLNVNYELDLWKKNRDKTIQKGKDLEIANFDEKALFISLNSSVASAYFNVVNIDKQLELQKQIVNIRKEILNLTKENYKYGLSTATEVTLAEKFLTESESVLSDIGKYQVVFLNQLAALTSDTVDNSLSLERTSIDNIELPEHLPENFKNEVIQKRPDLLKAEAELQKSKIDVSLAKKDFLPDITLTGQFGFNSNTLAKSFNWDSYMLSGGVSLLETVFSGGQRKARLKAKKYKYEQVLQQYQKTILTSFQEVNDSLAMLKFDSQKNLNNLNRIDHEKDNLYSINIKYEHGAISYLDTLQYKERVLTLEKEQAQSKTDCFIDSLSLYKAVGGSL
ncbi:MAG: hypothetical protein A2039_03505 [Candidatus Melainabacteria bacterium GWA2_34_9]|nr:MAG: hypothetical protein A2039_03505 [Candidatus Melainabacteria bacterium GWA2_34_9]